MYIKDGIAYADSNEEIIKVVSVKPLADFILWVKFSNSDEKTIDMKSFLDKGVFKKIKDKSIFAEVYIDCGVVTWCDGEIDIATEMLYLNGVSLGTMSA